MQFLRGFALKLFQPDCLSREPIENSLGRVLISIRGKGMLKLKQKMD
jgi:hypothetical protein